MNNSKSIFRYFAILVLCSLLLTGCSSIPFQSAKSYFKELYKRIPYKTEGHYRVVDIFYATNRQIKNPAEAEPVFTSKMSDSITYGTLNAKIDPGIKIGTMLPNRLKRKGMIGVQKVDKLDESAFLQQVADAVASSPHNSLLVIVFGYKDNFEATAIKAAYFMYLLDVNTPVLLFDWPGDQAVSISGYEKARSLAEASGPNLSQVLMKIICCVKPKKLWVKASSLGCQVVCDAFDDMYKNDTMCDADVEIDHVILTAPDVGQNEFDTKFKKELAALSRKFTAYVSSNDEALLMSAIIDGEKKLGRQKIKIKEKEQEQLEETKGILYLKSLDPDRITMIDVTPINKASYGHGYYLEEPEFFDDLYQRIFDKDPGVNRRLYLLKVKDNTDYWILQGSK